MYVCMCVIFAVNGNNRACIATYNRGRDTEAIEEEQKKKCMNKPAADSRQHPHLDVNDLLIWTVGDPKATSQIN